MTTSQIAVWCGNVLWSNPFARIASPGIPGSGQLTHPRMKFANGSFYLAVQRGNTIYITKRVGSSWTTPVQVSHPGAYVPYYPDLSLPLPLRTGPQFDFAVGPASSAGLDEVRVLYQYRNSSNRLGMAVGFCPASLTGCYYDPAWWTDPSYPANYFNPRIDVSPYSGGTADWKVAFDMDDLSMTNQVSLRAGSLTTSGSSRLFLHYELVPNHEVCADDRGYWGDYDDLKFVKFVDSQPQFIVTGTDSSNGCAFRDTYLSHEVHVSSVLFR